MRNLGQKTNCTRFSTLALCKKWGKFNLYTIYKIKCKVSYMYDLTKYFIDFQTSENNLERKNWKGSDLILKKYFCMYVELYAFHPNLLQTSVNIVYHERKKVGKLGHLLKILCNNMERKSAAWLSFLSETPWLRLK